MFPFPIQDLLENLLADQPVSTNPFFCYYCCQHTAPPHRGSACTSLPLRAESKEPKVPLTSSSSAAPRKLLWWEVSPFIRPRKEIQTCWVCTRTCLLLYFETLAGLFKQGLPKTDISLSSL